MNKSNQYLINDLLGYTKKIYNSLKIRSAQEDLYFLPVGILFAKWIIDSKERFPWKIPDGFEKIFTHEYSTKNYTQDIYNAAAQVEEYNPLLKGLFTSLCFSNMDYFEAESLRDAIQFYSKFQFDNENTEEYLTGPFIELFLQDLSNNSSFYSFITPQSIRKILAQLFYININVSVSDITAGTCSLLTEFVKEYYASSPYIDKVPNLYAQEINFKIALIGRLNLLLHGVINFDIVIKDTINEPILSSKNNFSGFDVLLSNLPLGVSWNRMEVASLSDLEYGLPGKQNADWVFIQRGIASLNPLGKAAFIVSKGTLTRKNEKDIRKNILEKNIIEAIISLPSNLYGPKSIPIEILIINKCKEANKKNKILFIDGSKEFVKIDRGRNDLAPEHIDKILETYHKWKEIRDYSRIADISEIEKYNFELESSLYVYSLESPSNQRKMKRLKEVAEIKRGMQILKNDVDRLLDPSGSHFYIKIGDINNDTIYFNEKVKNLSETKIQSFELKPEDIIISARGALIKTALFKEEMPASIISSNVMLIRVNSNYNPYFLKFYLDSDEGRALIENMQGGSTITALNHSKLQELLVPDVDLETQNRLAKRIKANELNYKAIIESAENMYKQNKEIISKEIEDIIKS